VVVWKLSEIVRDWLVVQRSVDWVHPSVESLRVRRGEVVAYWMMDGDFSCWESL
jgi:hypothetical protein